MSTNRRMNLRKNKSNNKDGNQSISNFVQRKSKDVEIVEDDEDVVQVTDEYTLSDETVLRPLRRKKKKIAVVEEEEDEENDTVEFGGMEDMDEEEKKQMKEALRQSRLELENDKKRREIYQTFVNSKFNMESDMTTTSTADIPSSPISSSIEPLGTERAESPDLFGPMPQSNTEQDKKFGTTSSEPSSSKSDFKSYQFQKEINIQLSPVQRPSLKRNLSVKTDTCKERPPHNEQPAKSKTSSNTATSKEKGRISKSVDYKKRKHSIEDDSDDDGYDGAKESIKEPPTVDSRKRQKTIEDNFAVLPPKKPNNEETKKQETNLFVINDDEDEDIQDENRNPSTRKNRKASRVNLKRKYRKHRQPIKTIKDAMKARLFFSPPGINQKLYTFAIMRMLDHSKECIRKAQQKSLLFAKWGEPIVEGPREGDSLDAKKDKRKSNICKKESSHVPPELKTRRSFRSTQSRVPEPTKIEPNSTKTEKNSTETHLKTKNLGFVSSDDSDEELAKSVFGHKENKPAKSWTEYNSRTDSFKFGENVNTSATRVMKDDQEKDKNILDNKEKKDVEACIGLKQKCDNNIPNDLERKVDKETTSKLDNEDEKQSFQSSNSSTPDNIYFTDNITTTTETSKEGIKINKENIAKQSNTQYKEENNDSSTNKVSSSTCDEKTPNKSINEQNDSDTDDSDSSAEIGKLKVKRSSRKSAVIEDIEEDGRTSGRTTRIDVEMIDVDDVITPTGTSSSKPGESLTGSASKSGFLKASRTEIQPPVIQRQVPPAAKKAAEAAEKRMKQQNEEIPSGSGTNISKKDSFMEKNLVQCPMCYSDFPFVDIEAHASMCNGIPPESNQTDEQFRRGVAEEQGHDSPSPEKSQQYGLKDLRVVVTRSPEAQRRLNEGSCSSIKAKKNLSLTKKGRMDTNKVVTDVVDMTSDDDDDDTPRATNSNDGHLNEDESKSASRSNFDGWPMESQETRKKAKFKVTYGGKKKNGAPKNPFSTLDYIPLQEQPASSDNESDSTTRKHKERQTTPSANVAQTTPNDCVDIDSDSDSEKEIYSMYGAKKPPAMRNINDVLRPQKQDLNFKKTKKKRKDQFDHEEDENERALMELAGMSSSNSSDHKRSQKDNKPKATKRRRKRATISSDDSEENGGCILCYVCNQHVPKEIYPDHTETCIRRKEGSAATPTMSCGDENHAANTSRRTSNRQTAKPSTSNTVEMDSDEIGNSPIKTFKLIGEGESSAVDFANQFSFLGNKTRSSSKRGAKGGRGQGRGRYKKKYWRKKKNNRQEN
ncbi:nucleolar protein dao-5 [Exaiptasia diaphana]|uniref:Uncharacterized protein n=1 Tax=Exaiptasia diaphana TaxID=2652724 RepID=A0A913XBN9_EXADI|nr:nucleolar protein dao-5 [Exaiptasia diaphana]KXJ13254.1 hypothetical protein AC249_AIPGENE23865 [Exaiptasia diaphana]